MIQEAFGSNPTNAAAQALVRTDASGEPAGFVSRPVSRSGVSGGSNPETTRRGLPGRALGCVGNERPYLKGLSQGQVFQLRLCACAGFS